MELGAFSISLAVKDIKASKAFYEKLGFKVFMGDISQSWLILMNGEHVIGLFQGIFERNILTFNPGWDSNAQKLDAFTEGPAGFMVMDPDDNPILVDQHV
jgi:catechol 2,3-dioxygenase-like lactoylglutathione lyase family enzyme